MSMQLLTPPSTSYRGDWATTMDTPLARILIADDEPLFLRTTSELLTKAGYECVLVRDAKGALAELQAGRYDLVLSDLHMPGNFHGELLRAQRDGWPQVPLIVVTGVPSLPTAIESIRLGIADYLLKPVRFEELLASVRRALAKSASSASRSPIDETAALELVGDCPAIRVVRETCLRAAQSDAAILITGEHGTGKHFVAKMIHEASRHRGLALTHVRCAAASAPAEPASSAWSNRASVMDEILVTLDEAAPIYLSSLESLSVEWQHALLHHLQSLSSGSMRQSRLISSTRCDLSARARIGQFLDELFYRLAVIQIPLPPLRERGADIELLARYFLAEHAARGGGAELEMENEVIEMLYQHAWPGNVQELKNAIDHAAAMAQDQVIRCEHLPPSIYVPREVAVAIHRSSRERAIGNAERQYLVNLLRENRGNIAKSAREAGLSRQGLHKLLGRYGIKPAQFRG